MPPRRPLDLAGGAWWRGPRPARVLADTNGEPRLEDERRATGPGGPDAAGLEVWHPARVAWIPPSGVEVGAEDAAVRLRGNLGFSWMGGKWQFLGAFDVWDDDGRFLGQRRSALDASWRNPALLRAQLSHPMLRCVGVRAPCANHVTVPISGACCGLHKNIEPADRKLLDRMCGDEGAGCGDAGGTSTPTQRCAGVRERVVPDPHRRRRGRQGALVLRAHRDRSHARRAGSTSAAVTGRRSTTSWKRSPTTSAWCSTTGTGP